MLDLAHDIGTQHDSSSNSALSDVDVTELWWSETELKSFQSSTTLLKKEIMKHEKYNNRQSYGDVLISSFLRCNDIDGPTPEQRHYLREWTRNAPSRRGIENVIVSELSTIRNESKTKAIQAVLTAQECCTNLSQDMKVEFIRSISECRTLNARTFASLIGDADACAVGLRIVTRRSSSTDTKSQSMSLHQEKKIEKNLIWNLFKTVKRMKRIHVKKRISI
jgi:hypothetical protein